jgi:hypothetical protein
MKNLILAILFALILIGSTNNVNCNNNTFVDNDSLQLRNDINESILEFISESGLNPDSSYIPFK